MNSNNYNLEELKSIIEILREVEAKEKDGEREGFFVDKIKPFIRDEKLLEEMERLNIEEYYEQDICIEIFESLSSNMSSKGLYFFITNVSLEFIHEVYTKENVEKINQALPEKNVSKEIFAKVMQSKELDENTRWGYYVPVIFENSSKQDKEKFKEVIIYYIDLFKDKISDPNAISILTKMLKDNDIEEITPNEFMSFSNFILDVDISNMIQSNLMSLLDIVIEKASEAAIQEGFDTFTKNLVSNTSIPNDRFSLDIKSNTLCKLLEKEKKFGNLKKEHVDKVIDILTIPNKNTPHISPEGIKRLWNCLDDDLKLQEYEHIVENVNSMELEFPYDYHNVPIDLWEESSSELQNKKLDYAINNVDKFKLAVKYRGKEAILQELWLKTSEDVKRQKTESLENIISRLDNFYMVTNEFIQDLMKNRHIYTNEALQELFLKFFNRLTTSESFGKYFEQYFLEKLTDSETSIFDNNLISRIVQKMDKELLSTDDLPESLKKAIISNREKIDVSDVNLEKYDDKVNSFQDMTEEEFSEFTKDIKKIKMKKGIIPERCCDYIISQAIRKNSTLNRNFEKNIPLLKRSFEDKSTYIAEEKGLPPIEVGFNILEEKTGGEAHTTLRSVKLIKYENKEIYSPINVINYMFHEIQHACQKKSIYSGKITDKNQYKMIKEYILRAIDQNYIDKNYIYEYSEIDARVQALIQQREYLQYLGLTKEEIENVDLTFFYSEGDSFEEALEFENRVLKNADYKEFENKVEKFDAIFEREIAKKPEYLNYFPVLQREFKLDGSRKTEEEMRNEMDKELANNPENRNQILFEYSVIMDKSLDELNPKASVEQSIFASIDASVSAEQRSEVANFIKIEKSQEESSLEIETPKPESDIVQEEQ